MEKINFDIDKLVSSLNNVENIMSEVINKYQNDKYNTGEKKWAKIFTYITGYNHHIDGHLSLPSGNHTQTVFYIEGQVRIQDERINLKKQPYCLNEHFISCGKIYQLELSEEKIPLGILRWKLSENYPSHNLDDTNGLIDFDQRSYFLSRSKNDAYKRRDELISKITDLKSNSRLLSDIPVTIAYFDTAKNNRDTPWFNYKQVLSE